MKIMNKKEINEGNSINKVNFAQGVDERKYSL